MGNHYHLLVETPFANLDYGMRWLNGVYAIRFNRRHGFDGHLFHLARFEPAVQQTQLEVGEDQPPQALVLGGGGTDLHLLGLFDQRANDERLPALVDLPAHEVVCSQGKLRVYSAAHFKIVRFYIARSISRTALHHVGLFNYGGIESHRAGKHRLVGGARNAVPLIEAAVLGEPAFPVSKVPFTVNGRSVAARG